MAYRKIYYRETFGEEVKHSFEYQINFVMQEGSISYLNKDGGITTRGVILQKEALDHFALLLNKGKPEQYRDGKNLKAENCYLKTRSETWERLIYFYNKYPDLYLKMYNELMGGREISYGEK